MDNRFVLISDSTCDLSPKMVEELDLHILPLHFTIGETTYFDGEIPPHEFYDMLRAGEMAVTSQITPTAFAEAFEPFLQEGIDVLYLAFSSGLSGTCNAAGIAAGELREKYPERRIEVVDSLAASMGEGLLAYHAANMRKEGASFDEVRGWLEDNKLNMAHWFTVDDLHFLKRGGRVSSAAALFGSMLGIKPVLHVDDEGHLIPMQKVRGRAASLEAMVAQMEKAAINPQLQTVFISHGDCLADAQKLADIIRKRLGVRDIHIHTVGPVIGSHSGPGTLALFYLGTNR